MRRTRIGPKSSLYGVTAANVAIGARPREMFAAATLRGWTPRSGIVSADPAPPTESWLTLRAATVCTVPDEDEERREDDKRGEPDSDADPDEREARWGFSKLGEQLSGLLDPEAALRRGQGLVTGVTQATKDEAMRIISAEVRNFLDGMDIADLAQQVISGLVVDVNMQVRFSREDPDAPAQPTITRNETTIRTKREADARAADDASPSEPKKDKT